jgi:hypothetical protein
MIGELVESNEVAAAQGIILAELQKEFGGSAEAASKTFGGSLNQLDKSIGNFKETIGGALAENQNFRALIQSLAGAIDSLAQAFTNLPEPVQTALVGLAGVAAILGKIAPALISAKVLLGSLGGSAAAAGTSAAGAAGGFAALGTAATGVLVTVGAALQGFALNEVTKFGATINKAFTDLLGIQLPPQIEKLRSTLIENGPFSRTTWQVQIETIQWGLNNIKNEFSLASVAMETFGAQMVQGLWQGIQDAWSWLTTNVDTALDNLLGWVQNSIGAHSPADSWMPLGASMAQGIGAGFGGGMGDIGPAMGAALQPGAVMSGGRGGTNNVTVNGRFYSPITKNERMQIGKEQRRIGEQLLLEVL